MCMMFHVSQIPSNSYVQPQKTIRVATKEVSSKSPRFELEVLRTSDSEIDMAPDITRSLYSKTLCQILQSLALGQLVEGPRQERKQITLHTATWSSISSNCMCSMFVRTFALKTKLTHRICQPHCKKPSVATRNCSYHFPTERIHDPQLHIVQMFPTSGSLHISTRILLASMQSAC